MTMGEVSNQTIFVVPFFLDGRIDQMRVYSDVTKAQAALRRYVGYQSLSEEIARRNPGLTQKQVRLRAYGAIDRTPFAGTQVWAIEIDGKSPVRKRMRR